MSIRPLWENRSRMNEQLLQALREGIDAGIVRAQTDGRTYLVDRFGAQIQNQPDFWDALEHIPAMLGYKASGHSWDHVDRVHSAYTGGRWASVRLLPRAARRHVRRTPQSRGQVRHAPRRTRRAAARAPGRPSDDPSPRSSRLTRLLRRLARILWGER